MRRIINLSAEEKLRLTLRMRKVMKEEFNVSSNNMFQKLPVEKGAELMSRISKIMEDEYDIHPEDVAQFWESILLNVTLPFRLW